MEKSEKMVEELTQKRKMTQIVKDMLNKRIFANCLAAISIIIYISSINVMYIYASKQIVDIMLKVFSMFTITLTIIIFEIAYRKDSGIITIFGIEFLVLSVLILYIPKIYGNLDRKFYRQLLIMPLFFSIYYVVKSIIIHFKTEKEYRSSLSDVKEIVKDEEK